MVENSKLLQDELKNPSDPGLLLYSGCGQVTFNHSVQWNQLLNAIL